MKPVIFISWSKPRARAVAEAIHDLLSVTATAADPFMSSLNLDEGRRWSPQIAEKLEASHMGVIVVTPENQAERWLNFEAGALSKHLDKSRVIPFAVGLGVSDIERPLGEFQSVLADKAGTWAIVKAVNTVLGDDGLTAERLRKVFDAVWPEFEEKLNALPEPEEHAEARSVPDMVRETLNSVRELERMAKDSSEYSNIVYRRELHEGLSEASLKLRRAELELAHAETALDDATQRAEAGSISTEVLEARQRAVENAKLAYREARVRVNRLRREIARSEVGI